MRGFVWTVKKEKKAFLSIKLKNSEGRDRIPQRILVDAAELLIKPFAAICNYIYQQKIIPEQW